MPCSDPKVGVRPAYACSLLVLLLPVRVARADEPVVPSGVSPAPTSVAGAARTGASEARGPSRTEVVVHGQRPPLRHVRYAPTVASTVIDGENLRRSGSTTADALERVAGVQVARTGASSDLATASIRGADARQIPVYLAGIRINDDVSGTADLSQVPLFLVERVEIFRGNAPERGDRLGIGGAVFLWPRRPRESRLGAGGGIGSYGERSTWTAFETGSDAAASLVALRRSQADNDYPFLDDRGRRFDRDERLVRRTNADFVAHDAWAVGRARLGDVRVSTVLSAFDREQGVTGLSVVPAEHGRANARRLLAGISANIPCGRTGGCAVELSSSAVAASTTIHDPFAELPAVRSPRLDNDGRRFVQRAATTLRPNDALSIGASVVHASGSTRVARLGGLPHRGRRESTRIGLTGSLVPSDPWLVSLFAAVQCHTTWGVAQRYGEPLPVDGHVCGVLEPTARAGTRWTLLGGLELLSNVGRYVRVPTLGEIFGTSASVDGSEALSPEVGITADAGVRHAASAPAGGVAHAFELFAFSRWASDLIRYRRTSASVLSPFNVASARVRGVEAHAGLDWVGWVRAEAAATVLDAQETTDSRTDDPTTNDVLPLTSRLVVASRLEAYQVVADGPLGLERVAGGVSDFYRSSRFADSAGLVVLPPQHRVDVDAMARLASGAVTARVQVRNVLGRLQHDLLGMPLPGRTVHVGLEVWF